MNETIYILLPVHNRREVTRRFINCLKLQSYGNYHLVLIDDGSSDGTADMVRANVPSLSVITGNGTWWWAGALQQGYRWLRARNAPSGDIILIINDDTEFEPDFFETAVAFLREHPKTFVLAECYDMKNNTLIDAGIHVDWKRFTFEQPSHGKLINCLSTRGLFFRVEDFYTVGGFHPFLLPHYLSDYEFTMRARRKGIELKTTPLLRVRLDTTTTGYHNFHNSSAVQAIKLIFSPKSAINPIPLIVFIALACPWRYKLAAVVCVLQRSIATTWKIGVRENRQ